MRVVNECTGRMLAGWVVVTRRSPRNLAHAHLSYSYQLLSCGLWTISEAKVAELRMVS
jgi:hypothetical protein